MVEGIVHNSPALDSLKHQQLRSLCARHGLKSTGKKEHLIKRLKTLRDTPLEDGNEDNVAPPTSEDDTVPLDGSFDILDDQEAQEAQYYGSSLPGSFETERNTRASSIDEFGSLSTADSHTITRSSSWKDRLASVFGGSGLATSSSSGSLSSVRTATAASSSRASEEHLIQITHQANNSLHGTSSSMCTVSAAAIAPEKATSQRGAPAPPTPATAPFRIVEDSFIQANSTTYPDCSFVPRTSFEGDSVDLMNVPVWPPPPGVILISPRQSPNKVISTASTTVPVSAQKKRYLDDVEEDDDNEEMFEGKHEEGRYGSIRLIPKKPLDSIIMTPNRKIAALPKKMSIIASSPPRFDLEAPPLPSLATIANQALKLETHAIHSQTCDEANDDNEGDATVIMEDDKHHDPKPSSDTLESTYNEPSHQQPHLSQPFIFGSPRQVPLTDDSFLKRIDGFAIAKQLEELQRRTGNVSSTSENSAVSKVLPNNNKGFMTRTASSGNLQSKNGVRFEGKHEKEFKMMDSIANHYAARRKVSNTDMKASHQLPNKRTRTESSDGSSALSSVRVNKPIPNSVHRQVSCPALSTTQVTASSSSMGLNQQGRYAPVIPPRPKTVKTSAQQAEDRERIKKMQCASISTGLGQQRRAGRASMSPRKAVINPSTRKLPPLSSASNNANSIGSNTSSNGTASKLFKSTFRSLKSLGSSSSLSSKATLEGLTNLSSSRSVSGQAQQHVSEIGTLPSERIPASASGSITRPTIASLARQQSRQNLDGIASPRQALSPRSVSASEKANFTSPRPGTLEKKKVSSISASHRNSPLKSNLDDSISQARRIRAKKLGTQIQSHRQQQPLVQSISRSPSKNAGLINGTTANGSMSSRPAWR